MALKQLLLGGVFDAPTSHNTSIDFNGVDERLENSTAQAIGIANTFSIMMWFRRRGDVNGLTLTNVPFEISGAGTINQIQLQSSGGVANDPFIVRMHTPFPSSIHKDHRFNLPFFPFDVWHHALLTYDGPGNLLRMYENGVLVTPSLGSFSLLSIPPMDDVAPQRQVIIGSSGSGAPFSGFVHSVAVWDTLVDSAIVELYNAGVASTFDLNAASFAGSLAHWWRLGFDPTDIGKDFAASGITPLINVGQNSVNIDVSDISSNSPP